MFEEYPLILTWEVNDSDLLPMFEKLSIFARKTVPELVRERGGTMARYLAENTQPVAAGDGGAITNDNTWQGTLDGGSLTARDLGRSAVRRDLRRVYASPSGVFQELKSLQPASPGNQGAQVAVNAGTRLARAFYSKLKKGKLAEAKALLVASGMKVGNLDVMLWDDGARHRRLRNNRGRVNRGNKPQVINDAAALKAYSKQRVENVGYTKAAWINAGKDVTMRGMTRVRMWIQKHVNAPGRGIDLTGNPDFPRVTLTNAVPWASEALSPKQFSRAQTQLAQAIHKELEIILDRLAENERRRTEKLAA